MALPTFDKRDAIPQGFEEEYEERDGKWVPIDRTGKLNAALKEEREAREKAEGLAKKAAKELHDRDTKQRASAGGMSERELKELHDSIEADIRADYEPKLADLEKIRSENRSLKLDSKVKALFKEAGVLPSRIDDMWRLHQTDFDLTSDDKPMVKNEPGKEVMRHVQAIAKARPEWVQGTKASGGRSMTFPNSTQGANPGPDGLAFDDVIKNPAAAIAVANEG